MHKSPLIDHLEVALRLAKSDERFLASYFIEMAIDAARKSEALSSELAARSAKKRR